jgi:uncharacterized protein (DUF1501 family)
MTMLSKARALIALLAAACGPTPLVAQGSPALPPVNTLVLIQLAGGNDGLDAVIPFGDPAYAALRKTLAPAEADLIKLDAKLALHPALAPLLSAWKEGDFAIALGVGYPDPNRSHFRSTDIWETASASREVLDSGWLARLLTPATRPASIFADSLILGETQAGPLKGPGMHNISMDNLDAFLRDAAQIEAPAQPGKGNLGYIDSIEADIIAAAAALAKIKPAIKESATAFPDTGLGRQMKTAFQLLAAGLRVPVIKLTLRGFDTHSAEKQAQEKLLGELAGAVAAFRLNLIREGLWDRVLVMTYSEFGRRAEENASGGTDHGTAAPAFLLGGKVKGGFYGSQPSLAPAALENGDLAFSLDFRSLYRSVAQGFLGIKDPAVLASVFPKEIGVLPLFKP